MKQNSLKVHPEDNVIVALSDLKAGEKVSYDGVDYNLIEDVVAKHKFATTDMDIGDVVKMYGVTVGKAVKPIFKGGRITTDNIVHDTTEYVITDKKLEWKGPDVSSFNDQTFMGYHRPDGKVGTFELLACDSTCIL